MLYNFHSLLLIARIFLKPKINLRRIPLCPYAFRDQSHELHRSRRPAGDLGLFVVIGFHGVEILGFHRNSWIMSRHEDPMHPGEVLKELYLDPLEMGAIAFARRLDVPRTRIERLIKGTTGITPDTALRLARVFNTTPAYWVNLQTNYDMALAAKEIDVSDIEPLVAA
jgi:addiction module HigA family antidote